MGNAAENDPLVVRSLEFLGGLAPGGGFRPPGDLPEVAFVGRSNSGKSSLLNKLVRRRSLARVSRTPGRTREINFFLVNGSFILADLPGYGYARMPLELRERLRPFVQDYIRSSRALRGVVVLLDVRRDPSPEDVDMFNFLADTGMPTMAAITKVDKLSRARARERVAALSSKLGLEADQIIAFSAVTGEGRDELAGAVASLVAPSVAEP